MGGNFWYALLKNGAIVARSTGDRGIVHNEWNNDSATLIYREKVPEATNFKLCYWMEQPVTRTAEPGMLQIGYKIYGTGYDM